MNRSRARSAKSANCKSDRSKTPNSKQAPPRATRKRLLALAALALVAALVLSVSIVFLFRPPVVLPPSTPVASFPEAVRQIINSAQHLVREHPQSSDAWGQLGMILMAHRVERDARDCLEQAAKLDPGEFRWPYLLGVSLSVERPKEARDYFEQAIVLSPKSAIAHCRLAELNLGRNAVAEAEAHLQAATQLDPRNARAWLGLARVAFLRKDYETSRDCAERSLNLARLQRAPHAMLARVYQALGERSKALEHLKIAQQLPDHTLLWHDPVASEVFQFRQDTERTMEEVEHLSAAGNLADAIATLDQAIAAEPQELRFHAKLAKLLIENGNLAGAAFALDRTLEDHGASSSLHFQRGVVHFLENQFSEAEEHFRLAIRYKPDHAPAYYNLGHTKLKQDEPDEAQDAFEAAIRFQPDHADARINLGKLLLEQGNAAAARPHVELAHQLKPDDPQLGKLLREVAR